MVNKTTSIENSLRSLIDVAADLSAGLSDSERYRRLLAAAHRLIPYDAAAILQLERGSTLRPVAAIGLHEEVLGRRFRITDHPRLETLVAADEVVIFPPDSELPDPYDGLVDHTGPHLDVHACMGARLNVHGRTWGVITFDALEAGRFDDIDPVLIEAFGALAGAAAATASYIERLERRAELDHDVVQDLTRSSGMGVEMIGDSNAMNKLFGDIDVVARSGFTVLVTGETGTGKELIAQRLHARSERADQPLIQLNCAALPDSLAESELFGHRRGAFTGATADRRGKFALADGGTLFLDEVGELPLGLQAKLLRALQSGEIQRVGDDHTTTVDVRVIAATNRDLEAEVRAARFREDLYQRLSVYPITVPPLRERRDDIALLSGYFLERLARQLGRPQLRLSDEALARLREHTWPGNVRELQHALSRAALRAPSGAGVRSLTLSAAALDFGYSELSAPSPVSPATVPAPKLADATTAFQREVVAAALERHAGNQAAAARELGLDRSNFHRLRKRLFGSGTNG